MKSFNSKKQIFSSLRLRQILTDLKRRPEDAASDLGISLIELEKLLKGTTALSEKLARKITSVWPIKIADLINPFFDKEPDFKIMRSTSSLKTSRIMKRGGIDYYEYRDTVMSKNAPFRPEWIRELSYVSNNDTNNKSLRWNRGHLLHQFTYFVGEINFYFYDKNHNKKVAVMNTGDSMYIGPYVPHTFATRNKDCKGFIIAITYMDKISTDVQNELLDYGEKKSSKFFINSSNKNTNKVSVLKYKNIKTRRINYNKNIIFHIKELASTKIVKNARSFELEVVKNNKYIQSKSSHQYIYILSKTGSMEIENKKFNLKHHDTIYIKPHTNHVFLSKGLKVLVVSIDGKISGETLDQLIQVGKKNLKRIIYDSAGWFKS